ncbi:EamA family transporter [Actinomadura parmotrematis]|uniref:EamA family transporter n=1 Tax=Actinomadura parmotrematis TaxID=2864039 RepID=UPI0027E2C32D|nr:EamA family transporter [Actinomadura parmotrematis]
MLAFAVIVAGVLHAGWNAIAKGVPDRWAGLALIGTGEAVVALAALAFVPVPAAAAWPWLLASVAVHLVYMGLLLASYQLGDFSQVYPLARGSAPLIVAAVAAVALSERLSLAQTGGVVAVSAGLAVLALVPAGPDAAPRDRRAVGAALLTGASIAAYTVLDGSGVRDAGSAAGYALWLFALEAPLTVLLVRLLRRGPLTGSLDRRQALLAAAGGVISMAAYGIVLWAQTRGALASVAALRETGVISGAVIGAVFFGERMGARRVAAACVVAAGVLLITAA